LKLKADRVEPPHLTTSNPTPPKMKKNRFSKILRPGKEKEALREQLEEERRERDRATAERLQKLEWQLEQERRQRQEEENARALAMAQEASRKEYEKQQSIKREKTMKVREKMRQEEVKKKARLVSEEKLRELRDHMRLRYALDVEIWNLRNVRGPDRPVVIEKMEKADAVLRTILETMDAWKDTHDSWTDEEWEKIGEVYDRIRAPGKRWWMEEPPWPTTNNMRGRQFS